MKFNIKRFLILLVIVFVCSSSHPINARANSTIVISDSIEPEVHGYFESELSSITSVIESICLSNNIALTNLYIGTPFKTFSDDIATYVFPVFADDKVITCAIVEPTNLMSSGYTVNILGTMNNALNSYDKMLFFWNGSNLYCYADGNITEIYTHRREPLNNLGFIKNLYSTGLEVDISVPLFRLMNSNTGSILYKNYNLINRI